MDERAKLHCKRNQSTGLCPRNARTFQKMKGSCMNKMCAFGLNALFKVPWWRNLGRQTAVTLPSLDYRTAGKITLEMQAFAV